MLVSLKQLDNQDGPRSRGWLDVIGGLHAPACPAGQPPAPFSAGHSAWPLDQLLICASCWLPIGRGRIGVPGSCLPSALTGRADQVQDAAV